MQCTKAFEVNSSSKQHYNDGINIELAIVKELVQHHKGSIHLESDVDQGSTYTVIFPQSMISQDDLDVDSSFTINLNHHAHLSLNLLFNNISKLFYCLIAFQNYVFN